MYSCSFLDLSSVQQMSMHLTSVFMIYQFFFVITRKIWNQLHHQV